MIVIEEKVYKDIIVNNDFYDMARRIGAVSGSTFNLEDVLKNENKKIYLDNIKNKVKEIEDYEYKSFNKVLPQKLRLTRQDTGEYRRIDEFKDIKCDLNTNDLYEGHKITGRNFKSGNLHYYIDRKSTIEDIEQFFKYKQECLDFFNKKITELEKEIALEKAREEEKQKRYDDECKIWETRSKKQEDYLNKVKEELKSQEKNSVFEYNIKKTNDNIFTRIRSWFSRSK